MIDPAPGSYYYRSRANEARAKENPDPRDRLEQLPMRHAILWDGRDSGGRSVPGGVYCVRMEFGGTCTAQRVIRLR